MICYFGQRLELKYFCKAQVKRRVSLYICFVVTNIIGISTNIRAMHTSSAQVAQKDFF